MATVHITCKQCGAYRPVNLGAKLQLTLSLCDVCYLKYGVAQAKKQSPPPSSGRVQIMCVYCGHLEFVHVNHQQYNLKMCSPCYANYLQSSPQPQYANYTCYNCGTNATEIVGSPQQTVGLCLLCFHKQNQPPGLGQMPRQPIPCPLCGQDPCVCRGAFKSSARRSYGFNPSHGSPYGGGTKVPAIKCQIWWELSTGSYVVSSPYNEKLVNGLKHVIPSGDRQYDNSTKYWYIKEQYGDAVKMIAEQIFGVGTVSFVSKQAAEQAHAAKQAQSTQQPGAGYQIPPAMIATMNSLDLSIVCFFRLCSFEAAQNAFRLTAASLHPDKGGDPNKMSELNTHWATIKRELFKR